MNAVSCNSAPRARSRGSRRDAAVVTPAVARRASRCSRQRLERAKDFIADEQWERAIEELKAAAADPKERNKDEALFWLAHSQNQARDLAAAVQTIRGLEQQYRGEPLGEAGAIAADRDRAEAAAQRRALVDGGPPPPAPPAPAPLPPADAGGRARSRRRCRPPAPRRRRPRAAGAGARHRRLRRQRRRPLRRSLTAPPMAASRRRRRRPPKPPQPSTVWIPAGLGPGHGSADPGARQPDRRPMRRG